MLPIAKFMLDMIMKIMKIVICIIFPTQYTINMRVKF